MINSMLLYNFHIYVWPVALLKSIDRCSRNFMWSGNIHIKKIVRVAWKKCCLPYTEGGLGLRSIKAINSSVLLKLSWSTVSSNGHWAIFLKSIFIRRGKPIVFYAKSLIWPGVRKFLQLISQISLWLLGDGSCINFWKH